MSFVSFILIGFILLPKVGFLDLGVFLLLIYLFTLLVVSRNVDNYWLDKGVLFCVFLWFLSFILALFSYLYHEQISTQILFKPIRQIIILTSVYLIVCYHRFSVDEVLRIIYVAAFVNALVIIIQFATGIFIPGSQGDFLLNPNFNREINMAWRKPGLFAGYPHSALLSAFGSVIGLYFMRKASGIKEIVIYFITFLSLFLSSRTGLMLGFFGILILLPYYLKYRISNTAYFITLIASIIIVMKVAINNIPLVQVTFDQMFEVFINIAQGKGVSSSSTDDLMSSYAFPIEHLSTFFFGNGYPHHADNYANVDSGVQISFFAGGFFHLLIVHLVYFYMWYRSVKCFKFGSSIFVLINLLYFFVFVANFKGGFLFSRGPSDALLLLFLSCFFIRERSNLNKDFS
ncbi:hypothetical protein AB6D56_15500 [Vibrio lentus]